MATFHVKFADGSELNVTQGKYIEVKDDYAVINDDNETLALFPMRQLVFIEKTGDETTEAG